MAASAHRLPVETSYCGQPAAIFSKETPDQAGMRGFPYQRRQHKKWNALLVGCVVCSSVTKNHAASSSSWNPPCRNVCQLQVQESRNLRDGNGPLSGRHRAKGRKWSPQEPAAIGGPGGLEPRQLHKNDGETKSDASLNPIFHLPLAVFSYEEHRAGDGHRSRYLGLVGTN